MRRKETRRHKTPASASLSSRGPPPGRILHPCRAGVKREPRNREPPNREPRAASRESLHEQLRQVFGSVGEGLHLSDRDVVEALVARAGGAAQRFVPTIAHVEKADVVALAVEAAERRLIG